jgi:hypothetical protein
MRRATTSTVWMLHPYTQAHTTDTRVLSARRIPSMSLPTPASSGHHPNPVHPLGPPSTIHRHRRSRTRRPRMNRTTPYIVHRPTTSSITPRHHGTLPTTHQGNTAARQLFFVFFEYSAVSLYVGPTDSNNPVRRTPRGTQVVS